MFASVGPLTYAVADNSFPTKMQYARRMTGHASHTIDCDEATPRFAASFLRVAGDECAFIETYTSHALPRLLGALASAGKTPNDVRYVVITHAHLDHAAGASALMRACPKAILLAHPRAARHMIDPGKLVASATGVYGKERFAALYGTIDPIPAERVRALEDGESFMLGDATLSVFHTAGHANHHFVVHDPTLETVYTGDTFGLVYPALQAHGRFAFPSTSPTNFDPAEARKSIDRVLSLGAKAACLTHFGEVRDLDEVASQMRVWIDRAERWLDEATLSDESVEAITTRLTVAWRDAVTEAASVRGATFVEEAHRHLAMDIELNAQGIAVVAIARRKQRA